MSNVDFLPTFLTTQTGLYALFFILPFAITAALCPLVIVLARRWDLQQHPNAEKWHRVATPSIGGVAIYIGWALLSLTIPAPARHGLLVGGTLIFLTGLFDDIRPLGTLPKLTLQLVVAFVLLYYGVRFPGFGVTGLSEVLTVLWLVGMTNALNLIDNMDGLCAGTALIIALQLFCLGLVFPSGVISLLCLSLAGAALGFLIYNRYPAKVFMGDCGSMLFGLVLAAVPLISPWQNAPRNLLILFLPISIFLVPVLDTLFVIITRLRRGQSVAQGGKDHLSHRLVARGFSEKQAVHLLYTLSLLGGTLMFLAVLVAKRL